MTIEGNCGIAEICFAAKSNSASLLKWRKISGIFLLSLRIDYLQYHVFRWYTKHIMYNSLLLCENFFIGTLLKRSFLFLRSRIPKGINVRKCLKYIKENILCCSHDTHKWLLEASCYNTYVCLLWLVIIMINITVWWLKSSYDIICHQINLMTIVLHGVLLITCQVYQGFDSHCLW